MVNKSVSKKCMGLCPNCNSGNLDYGPIEPNGESIFYPFTCEDCGTKGKEYYSLEYSETLIQKRA